MNKHPVCLPPRLSELMHFLNPSACPDWLMTYSGLGSNPGPGHFQLVGSGTDGGYAMRAISLPVSSINCDRPLHSGIRASEL